MRYLVTGGAGFIGSNLVKRLLKQGNEVVLVDNFSTGKEENISGFEDNALLKVHNKDVCSDILGLFRDVDMVHHVAALPRVQFSINNPVESSKVNIGGTLNVLEMCRKAGIKRMVYSSSSSIYGHQENLPFKESMEPNPMSPYALHKSISEQHCRSYHELYGIETISLRYFNVYGPKQDPYEGYALLIPKTIGLLKQGKPPVIFGDGEQTRDFTFVGDVVNANIIAGKTKNKGCFGQVFNIGSGKNHTVNKVVGSIIGNKDIKPVHKAPLKEPRDTLADISKAKELLGWEPEYSFEDGLRKTIRWFS